MFSTIIAKEKTEIVFHCFLLSCYILVVVLNAVVLDHFNVATVK